VRLPISPHPQILIISFATNHRQAASLYHSISINQRKKADSCVF